MEALQGKYQGKLIFTTTIIDKMSNNRSYVNFKHESLNNTTIPSAVSTT